LAGCPDQSAVAVKLRESLRSLPPGDRIQYQSLVYFLHRYGDFFLVVQAGEPLSFTRTLNV
jgi:hypothetical protein